jgi:hypothetical protein
MKAEAQNSELRSADDGMKDHAEISKTVTRRQGVSRVRIPPPPLDGAKGPQSTASFRPAREA